MKMDGEGQLVRIFVGEDDRWEGRPLFEAIVHKARELGLAGATVLRGLEGFGASSRIHTTSILRLSQDLPLLIEIVDKAEQIEKFLPVLDGMVKEGMITIEKVRIIAYRSGEEE
jgi:PII-like signaling protein